MWQHGVCLFCGGKGTVEFEEAENMIFDEEHGWTVDPDVEQNSVVKHIIKTCHMCEGGKCHYCIQKKQQQPQQEQQQEAAVGETHQ